MGCCIYGIGCICVFDAVMPTTSVDVALLIKGVLRA